MNKDEQKSLSLNQHCNRHEYLKQDNYMVCKTCGKKSLYLKQSEKKELLIGHKKDGKNYSVRHDRRRYFFPDEWETFMKTITDSTHKFFFIVLLHTGARIMEVLNLRHSDINIERGTINFKVVKQRKAKKNFFALGTTRSFFIATNFIKEYKSFIRGKTINKDNFIFLNNKKLPDNYNALNNIDKKKYYSSPAANFSALLKRKLKKSGIKDWYNFSPHNIRKTYGMWMRALNIETSELCYRLGHDINTYLAHYGSSLIFSDIEKRKIANIFGEIK